MICGIIANQGAADCAFRLDASDAEIYIGMTTNAADMTGTYPSGTTDICGTPL